MPTACLSPQAQMMPLRPQGKIPTNAICDSAEVLRSSKGRPDAEALGVRKMTSYACSLMCRLGTGAVAERVALWLLPH